MRKAVVTASLVSIGVLMLVVGLGGNSSGTGSLMKAAKSRDALYLPVTFAEVPGWTSDDQSEAWTAFRTSCRAIVETHQPSVKAAGTAVEPALLDVCLVAMRAKSALDKEAARDFFETNFVPHKVRDDDNSGLLTAYFEPVIAGDREPSKRFPVPLHRRPSDLVNLVAEADRAAGPTALTHARRTEKGGASSFEPYATRQQIDEGALNGRGLELFYVADEVERFFLQVQGSGVIELPDGKRVRIGYDGKNGHPYTSVGRYLIEHDLMSSEQMSLEAMAAFLRDDVVRGRHAMWQNKSYVFFREMPNASAAEGVMGVALTPLRSLAIDPSYHSLGLPVYVDAPGITHITGRPFQRLMIGQDVGSAIRGRQRGDIFAGTGPVAGEAAGITKHHGQFFVLLPKPDLVRR